MALRLWRLGSGFNSVLLDARLKVLSHGFGFRVAGLPGSPWQAFMTRQNRLYCTFSLHWGSLLYFRNVGIPFRTVFEGPGLLDFRFA